MARFRGVAVAGALTLGIVGCLYVPYEPAQSAQTPASSEPASTAQATTHVEPVPATNTAPQRAPLPPYPLDILRWRPAVENYVPSDTVNKEVRLNGATVGFAPYLTHVHTRIHPIFADQFLTHLDNLPASDPMNRADLRVTLEIVIESQEGRVQRMGVTASSGVIAFDVFALESVDRAQPFGPAPREIVSPDGFVYVHWQFHRGPEACGTWNARLFLVPAGPKAALTSP